MHTDHAATAPVQTAPAHARPAAAERVRAQAAAAWNGRQPPLSWSRCAAWGVVVGAFGVLGSSLAGLGLLVLVTCVVACTLALPPKLGWTNRALGATVLLFTGNALGALLLEVLGVPTSPVASVLLWSGPAVAVVVRRGLRPSLGGGGLRDVLPASAAAVTAAVLLLPWAGRGVTGRLALMQPFEDNATHLGIINAIRAGGSYLFDVGDSRSQALGLLPSFYPQGPHLNVALAADVVQGSTGYPGISAGVAAYSAGLLVAQVVMVWAVTAVAVSIAVEAGARRATWVVAGAVPVAALLGTVQLTLLRYGFINQIVSYAALAVLLLVMTDRRWSSTAWWQLIVGAAAATIGAAALSVAFPVLVVAGACLLWVCRGLLRRHPRGSGAVLGVLAVGAAAYSVIRLTPVGGGRGVTSAVFNNVGGVRIQAEEVLVGLVGISFLVLLRAVTDGRTRRIAPWAVALTAAVTYAVAVRQYQSATFGELSYQYYKATYNVSLLGVVGLGVAGALAMTTDGVRQRLLGVSLAALTFVGAGAFLQTQASADTELRRQTTFRDSDFDLQLALDLQGERTRVPVVYWQYGTPLDDYQRNRLTGAIYLQESRVRRGVVLRGFETPDARTLARLVEAGDGLLVITRNPSLARELTSAVRDPSLMATVRVLAV